MRSFPRQQMRIFFCILSVALGAAPTDLCEQLCARDGPAVCTGGSWTKPDGACQAYMFRGDPSLNDHCYHNSATATSCPSSGQPVRVSDVSRLLTVATTLPPSAPLSFVTTTVSPTDDEGFQVELARASEFINRRAGRQGIDAIMMMRTVATMDVEFRNAFYRAGSLAETDAEWVALNFFLRPVELALINGVNLPAARTRAMDHFLRMEGRAPATFRPAGVTPADDAPSTTRVPETMDEEAFQVEQARAQAFILARASRVNLNLSYMCRALASMDAEFRNAFYRVAALTDSESDWGMMSRALSAIVTALNNGEDVTAARQRAVIMLERLLSRVSPFA